MTLLPESDVVFTATEIQHGFDEMAQQLTGLCGDEVWTTLCVMNGGLMMTGEIMKRLSVPMILDFVHVSRYGDSTSAGTLRWQRKPSATLNGANVLLLDDIFDEGETLAALVDFCREEGAARVLSAVLLEKRHDRKATDYVPDVVGLSCEDRYVFGFGMDCEGLWRNLPEIRALR